MDAITVAAFEMLGGAVITAILGGAGFFIARLIGGYDNNNSDRLSHEKEMAERMRNIEEAIMQMQDAESERMAREQERFSIEQQRMSEFAQFKQAVLALLRDRINQGRRYYCDRGYITQYELENFQSLYEAYHCLGGNGMATKAYNDVCALPFEPPANDGAA